MRHKLNSSYNVSNSFELNSDFLASNTFWLQSYYVMTDSETIFCCVMHWTIVVTNIVLFHIEILKMFDTVTVSISKNKYWLCL